MPRCNARSFLLMIAVGASAFATLTRPLKLNFAAVSTAAALSLLDRKREFVVAQHQILPRVSKSNS
jgi:hypothetical protein